VTARRDGAVRTNNAASYIICCFGLGVRHAMRGSEASEFPLLHGDRRQGYHGSLGSSCYWHATTVCERHRTDRAVAIVDSDNSVAVFWRTAKIRFLQVVGLAVACSDRACHTQLGDKAHFTSKCSSSALCQFAQSTVSLQELTSH
jgi:hypothetical protein